MEPEKIYCVLCGQEVDGEPAYAAVYHERQTFHPACAGRYVHASRMEKRELLAQIVESPHLSRAEYVREAHKSLLSTISDLPCPACGTPLEIKMENFRIGADGRGGIGSLFMDQFYVDLYACPMCGKVELYAAGTRKARQEEEAPGEEEPAEEESGGEAEAVCPVCGGPLDEAGNCPACTRPRKKDGGFLGLGRRRDKRPPWEK